MQFKSSQYCLFCMASPWLVYTPTLYTPKHNQSVSVVGTPFVERHSHPTSPTSSLSPLCHQISFPDFKFSPTVTFLSLYTNACLFDPFFCYDANCYSRVLLIPCMYRCKFSAQWLRKLNRERDTCRAHAKFKTWLIIYLLSPKIELKIKEQHRAAFADSTLPTSQSWCSTDVSPPELQDSVALVL